MITVVSLLFIYNLALFDAKSINISLATAIGECSTTDVSLVINGLPNFLACGSLSQVYVYGQEEFIDCIDPFAQLSLRCSICFWNFWDYGITYCKDQCSSMLPKTGCTGCILKGYSRVENCNGLTSTVARQSIFPLSIDKVTACSKTDVSLLSNGVPNFLACGSLSQFSDTNKREEFIHCLDPVAQLSYRCSICFWDLWDFGIHDDYCKDYCYGKLPKPDCTECIIARGYTKVKTCNGLTKTVASQSISPVLIEKVTACSKSDVSLVINGLPNFVACGSLSQISDTTNKREEFIHCLDPFAQLSYRCSICFYDIWDYGIHDNYCKASCYVKLPKQGCTKCIILRGYPTVKTCKGLSKTFARQSIAPDLKVAAACNETDVSLVIKGVSERFLTCGSASEGSKTNKRKYFSGCFDPTLSTTCSSCFYDLWIFGISNTHCKSSCSIPSCPTLDCTTCIVQQWNNGAICAMLNETVVRRSFALHTSEKVTCSKLN